MPGQEASKLFCSIDAPAHGHAAIGTMIDEVDNYSDHHPLGLAVDSVTDVPVKKD